MKFSGMPAAIDTFGGSTSVFKKMTRSLFGDRQNKKIRVN